MAHAKQKVILHCIPGLKTGGTEHMLLRTLPKLKDFYHIVICLGKNGEIGLRLEESGIKVICIPHRFPILNIKTIRKFHKILLNYNPDILITYLPLADIFGKIFGRVFGIKTIVCSLRSTMRDIRYLPLIILEVLMSPLTTHHIAVSNAVKKRFVNFGMSPQKISVVPNGISLANDHINISSIKSDLYLNNSDCLIGIVGGLRKERGHRYIIKVLKYIKTIPHLLLIGDGPERNNLEEQTKKLGLTKFVHFLGFRKDVPEILKACDIFISSSFYEGMSNALLEAMSMGKAIIAIDVPENRELLTNMSSGILVKPKSSTALTNAIALLADNKLRGKLGANAQRQAQNFSLDNTLNQLSKLFHSL